MELVTYTAGQLASMFAVSREYVLKQARLGEWPSWRQGRLVRFFPEHVEQIKTIGSQPAVAPLTRQPRRRTPSL